MNCNLSPKTATEYWDDDPWDVFSDDDDGHEPEPEPGDFWHDEDSPFGDSGCANRQPRYMGRETRPC